MYVYIQSEPGLWTVGFYDPDGNFIGESDWTTTEKAAKRAAWLNGSQTKGGKAGMKYKGATQTEGEG